MAVRLLVYGTFSSNDILDNGNEELALVKIPLRIQDGKLSSLFGVA